MPLRKKTNSDVAVRLRRVELLYMLPLGSIYSDSKMSRALNLPFLLEKKKRSSCPRRPSCRIAPLLCCIQLNKHEAQSWKFIGKAQYACTQ